MKMTYREAVRSALHEALARDPRVFLMGEDVGRYGGTYAVSKGLLAEFGPERIRDTPLSESTFVGAGIGAALGGMRPIVEVMTVNFSLLALDQIVNNAATLRHMSGGQFSIPLVIRMATGAGRQLAAQHAHSLEGWYAHIPGLRIVTPATLEDARGMLWTALQDPDPVLIFEHQTLYNMEGTLGNGGPVDLDRAAIRRPGKDVTLVTYGATLWKSLEASEMLARDGVDVEVIDLRTLRPLDMKTIIGSVQKTRRVKDGRAEASRRRSPRASSNRHSTIWMRPSFASAPRKCLSHIRSTSKTRPCRSRTPSRPPSARSSRVSEFKMPALGADMEAGTLIQWLKHTGDALKRGDIIAIVDTQKGAIEIEVFTDGVFEKAIVQPGEKVPVGTVLAIIREPGAPVAPPAAPPPLAPAGRRRASPAARKRAEHLGVDLEHVTGTGPEGAITSEDVERAAAGAAPKEREAAAPQARAGMRTAIAAAMSRAKREIPHYYLSTSIDMSAAQRWLRAENEKRSVGDRLLMIAPLVKAVAAALRDVPELNGHWIDGAFRAGTGTHIGCAIALRGGGLVAPAVHDADRKDVGTLMREVSDLVARARAGSLKSSELSDATITITNLGDQGVDAGFGIIYPPQVALVGFGRIQERPWVVAGAIQPRPVMTATLSADHRASDGHRGGLFLSSLDRLLQAPEQL